MDRVAVVRALVERWNSGERDVAPVAELCDPAIELESPFSSVAGEPYRGLEGLERWRRDVEEQFSEWSISPEEVRDLGDAVFMASMIRARGRASGVELEFHAAGLLSFSGTGLVTRIRLYADVGEALAALGAGE
jgi:hypothetical protein